MSPLLRPILAPPPPQLHRETMSQRGRQVVPAPLCAFGMRHDNPLGDLENAWVVFSSSKSARITP